MSAGLHRGKSSKAFSENREEKLEVSTSPLLLYDLWLVISVLNPNGVFLLARGSSGSWLKIPAALRGCSYNWRWILWKDGSETEQENCWTLHASRTSFLQRWLLWSPQRKKLWGVNRQKSLFVEEIPAHKVGCCQGSVLFAIKLSETKWAEYGE